MLYVLVDDFGTPLGEFDDEGAAKCALADLVAIDPSAASECSVIALDEAGRRADRPAQDSARA